MATIACLPATAPVVCTGGLANETAADFEIFGLNADGNRSWVGQCFVTDCDAQFLMASFHILLGQVPVNGINPLTTGQELVCTVMNAQNRSLASVSSSVVGTLGVKLETPVDGYAYVQTNNDLVPGNMIINDGANTFNL